MRKARFGVFQYLAQKRAGRSAAQMKQRRYQDYLYRHQETFKKSHEQKKDKHILEYQDTPVLGYCFGVALMVVGIWIDYIAFHGEFQTLWSRLSPEHTIEFMGGTLLIWAGWAVVVLLEQESLRLDTKKDLVVVTRVRLFQSPLKQLYPLSEMDYFQIWKRGYHSRQNNNMRYTLMFIYGREKVKVMTKVDAISMKKVYVEIKTFLEQPFEARDLKIIDAEKAGERGERGEYSEEEVQAEEETALNIGS